MKRDCILQKAFTLSEAMITLGIVGVVAALTLPTLISNHEIRVNTEREVNAVQKITKSMEMMKAHSLLNKNYASTDEFVDELQKYLKVTKRCDANKLVDCWPTAEVINADGETYQVRNAKTGKHLGLENNTTNNVGLVLADGTPVILTYNTNSATIDIGDRADGITKKLPITESKDKEFPYTTLTTAPIAFVMDTNGSNFPNSEKIGNDRSYDIRGFNGASFAKQKLCGELVFDELSGNYTYLALNGEDGRTLACLSKYVSNSGKTLNQICNEKLYPSGGQQVEIAEYSDSNTRIRCFKRCLAAGTMITLADRSEKPIEDITYDDDILVWDFDNGTFASAKPAWIMKPTVSENSMVCTFANGAKLVGLHRFFDKERGCFTNPSEDNYSDITTFTADGTETKLVSKEIVQNVPIEYYNILTEKHLNCFANGVLTSLRINNLYPIKDYKFVKDNRKSAPFEEYEEYISYDMYKNLRIGEMPDRLWDKWYLNTMQQSAKEKSILITA